MPDIVTLGVRQRIGDRFRVMAGAEWSNWSRFGTVEVKGGPAPIGLPFEYDDGWYFSLGGEFDVTERATVRAGVGYQLSPIDDNVRTFRLPYSNGFCRQWARATGSTNASPLISATASPRSKTWTSAPQMRAVRTPTAHFRAIPTLTCIIFLLRSR